MSSKIKVICVDDSALIRDLLTSIINDSPDMEVVATAADPLIARELIKQHNPDVITLDVEMPRMDGLDFLEKLMRLRPMPVIMVSSLTQEGSSVTLRALELGAIDFVAKPQSGIRNGMLEYASSIHDKIRWAAKSRPAQYRDVVTQEVVAPKPHHMVSSEKLIIIGSSTGGTNALPEILSKMPVNSPAILIAQHMPGGFTKSFADRLNKMCTISVKEAEDGERVLPGHAYIAPGTLHMGIHKSGSNYIIKLSDSEPVNRHKPSVDYLFKSAAVCAGRNAIGAILTGMGKDGASGLLDMKNAGSYTFAQNEASCVVFGMPKEAIALNAACEILSLGDIAEAICKKASTERLHRV